MAGFDYIKPGINLQWIPTLYHLQSKWTIETYYKKKNIIQVLNKKMESMIQLQI